MNISEITKLECLPNEILLEIYRYIHCGHVIYSFYDLNLRFNRTINDYCCYVTLRRLNYQQYLHIFSHILPRIGPSVKSLTINRLQQPFFLTNFSDKINDIFSNLEKFAFDDWSSEQLFHFAQNALYNLKYLRKIIIRGLRRTNHQNSIPNLFEDFKYLFDTIYKTPQIESICFEPDCYSMVLLTNKHYFISQTNLIELSICLSTSRDLIALAKFIPNIRRIHVIIEKFVPLEQDNVPFQALTDFGLDGVDYYSTFEDISSILYLIPTVKQLSLTLSTQDERLIYGENVFHILPSKCIPRDDNIQSFKYAVYFCASKDSSMDYENILKSWKPIPVVLSADQNERKSYLFLHTLPYPSIHCSLYSTLSNKFAMKTSEGVYNNVQYLTIFGARNLTETFKIIQHHRNVKDLTIHIENDSIVTLINNPSSQSNICLAKLNKLEILSIFGNVQNWQCLQILLDSTPNISTLCIDLGCILKLCECVEENIRFTKIVHLFIDGRRGSAKLKNEDVSCLSKMFNRLLSLKIKYNTEELIDASVVGSVLDNFKNLIVFTVSGQISDEISFEHIQDWISQYSFRLKNSEKYKVQLLDNWFQIWL